MKAVIEAMERHGISNTLDTLVDRWFTDSFRTKNPGIVQARLDEVLQTPAEVFLAVFRIYASTEMALWLHQVKAPCLLLTGSLDAGCSPRLNREIHDRLPTSELVVLDGYKHAILKEASHEVASHIRRFIEAHDRRRIPELPNGDINMSNSKL